MKKHVKINELFKEFEAGESLSSLSKRYSYSPSGLRQLLMENNYQSWLAARKKKRVSSDANNSILAAKIFNLFEKGKSIKELCVLFNMNDSQVRLKMIVHDKQRYREILKRILKINSPSELKNKIEKRNQIIIRLYNEGSKVSELAKKFDISRQNIYLIFKKEGLSEFNRKKRANRNANILEDLFNGKSSENVAKKHRISKAVIDQIRISNVIPTIYQQKIEDRNTKIMELIKKGVDTDKIAVECNILESYVSNIARKNGIYWRKEHSLTPKIKQLLKKNKTPVQIAEMLQITSQCVYQLRVLMRKNGEL